MGARSSSSRRDGVLPSNTGRGYIFRRVLRRAVRHGKMLGLEGPFLADAADTVIEVMKAATTPSSSRARDRIVDVLSTGRAQVQPDAHCRHAICSRSELDALERRGKHEVPGEVAFKLYDTHGFPWS